MEVIIGSLGNTIFPGWLAHISKEIASKPYAEKGSFWYNAKMRYVFHTTGPHGMNRFLKLPVNEANVKSMRYLECNHFKAAESLTQTQRRFFDVISYQSQSYFTKAHEISVPVGPGDQCLPPLPTAKRMRVKCAVRRMGVSKASNGVEECSRTSVPARPTHKAPSQEVQEDDASRELQDDARPVGVAGSEAGPVLQPVADGEVASQTDAATDGAAEKRLLLKFVRLEQEYRQDRDRGQQLRVFFAQYKHSTAARVLLADMPAELSAWLAPERTQECCDRLDSNRTFGSQPRNVLKKTTPGSQPR
jgi:hypothetical protein